MAEGKGGDGADLMPPDFAKKRLERFEEEFAKKVAKGEAHPDEFTDWLEGRPVTPQPSPN